ncbi:endodeoxyribonuclease-like protein [Thermochaetoides thermophila DSM 1495]|uniref:Endodeoxyribonuclease-like protein n=1 Tax=Chaetomium thermophilum (strain DSM 1495 / CBS 144.50 / IMI 039719) TaxID=759272 RepID=G0RYK9_CHATD|nr:endodeoxyribonuclease-like protein [Thermochaetoides thermophila DSM 1495]EGS23995.1 endodeoxyribonuclease-like protein [Thermochaetoides thermophila DSM 1495]
MAETSQTVSESASQADLAPSLPAYRPRYIDIGINLADPIFRGRYHGKQKHPDDLKGVVDRAIEVGCTKLIVTGSSFKSTRDALKLCREFPGTVYATAGIHPCSSSIFSRGHHKHHDESESEGEAEHTPQCDPDPTKPIQDGSDGGVCQERSERIIADLTTLINESRANNPGDLVAFGEFGLDYDRLHYCSKEVQLHSFRVQLQLAASLSPQLPLFLHSRAAHADFVRLLKEAFGEKLEKLEKGGVVHSFTGTVEEMKELMDLGLYIGINGCSFKTAENCAVVKEVALDRLMIETDGPWCEVRPSHEGWKYLVEWEKTAAAATPCGAATTQAVEPEKQKQQGKKNQKKEPEVPERFKTVKKEKWEEGAMVKGRNEPCMIERVAKIIAAIKGVSLEEVCEASWANTVKVFGLKE